MANKKVQKVALKDTFSKITKTAKSVNSQIATTATEVFEDVMQNREIYMSEATKTAKTVAADATKTVKKMVPSIDVEKGFDQIKTTAKKVNTYSLETADGLVDAALENGKDWQIVAAKAVKGGLKLADKQQDIMFDTLESLKGQAIKSAGRFKELFSKN